jgi:hypothetical protein
MRPCLRWQYDFSVDVIVTPEDVIWCGPRRRPDGVQPAERGRNAMSGEQPVLWRKSTRSNGSGDCVSWAFLPNGTVCVRDDKDSDGPTLTFTRPEWLAFIAGVKDNEADPY